MLTIVKLLITATSIVEFSIATNFEASQCWIKGSCTGKPFSNATQVTKKSQCLFQCQDTSNCQWFTYIDDGKSPNGICQFYNDCDTLDKDVEFSLSGQRTCNNDKNSEILVVGGYQREPVQSVEIIDLTNGNGVLRIRSEYRRIFRI